MLKKMLLLAVLLVFAGGSLEAQEEAEAAVTAEVVLATGVEERQPVGEATEFAADVGTVYAWTRITGAANTFRNNVGPVLSVNANALNSRYVNERGRSRGAIDRAVDAQGHVLGLGNQGPLVAANRLAQYDENSLSPYTGQPNNSQQIVGMEIRPHTLTTETVWDDTDIVHVVSDEIYIPNFHTFGGLRLESNALGSLVVKLLGPTAGITAGGEPSDIADRIGGRLQVVGHGQRRVVLTSIHDDSIGAGYDPQMRPVTDTLGDGNLTQPAPGDWRSLRIR